MAERSWLPLGGRPAGWRAAVGRQQWDEWGEVMFKLLTHKKVNYIFMREKNDHETHRRVWP